MTEQEYQNYELRLFTAQQYTFFDTVEEFSKTLEDPEWLLQQMDWLENGSYGAGACLELQRVLRYLGARHNRTANLGQVLLHALYGAPFKNWAKLSDKAKAACNWAVEKWDKQEHDFAMKLL
jgi:hypothetical protein